MSNQAFWFGQVLNESLFSAPPTSLIVGVWVSLTHETVIDYDWPISWALGIFMSKPSILHGFFCHIILSKEQSTRNGNSLTMQRILTCESYFPKQNSPEAPWREEENVFLKIICKCNCWAGGTDFRGSILAVCTDFPPGLSRTSTLISDESGTLIFLFWAILLGSSYQVIKKSTHVCR